MKPFLTIALIALALSTKAIDVGVSHAVFQTPDGHAYLDIEIEVAPDASIFHWLDSVKMQAHVETVILIKQGENIVAFDKYVMNSPRTDGPIPFLDARRFSLKNGDYQLEITFSDVVKPSNSTTYTAPIKVEASTEKLFCSEIQLVASFRMDENAASPFVKSGFFLEPMPYAHFNKNAGRLIFYQEIIHSDRQPADDYLVRYFVEKLDAAGKPILAAIGNRRCKPSVIEPLLIQMDISKMESGNYRLTVEMRNRTNDLLSQKTMNFTRSNPLLDLDTNPITAEMASKEFVKDLDLATLSYSLRAIAPRIDGGETEVLKDILKSRDTSAMRLFLFNFFAKQHPNAPKSAYDEYMTIARAVDDRYKQGIGYGFESDRGFRFLKYGKPSDILTVEDDPAAPPYEIWQYNDFPATHQSNVKFLFYSPSLTSGDFVLLHSNARGEVSNPRWQRVLYKNAPNDWTDGDLIDGSDVKSNVNRHAKDFFSEF